MQITHTGTAVGKPQWSHDGKWLSYQLKKPQQQSSETQEQTEIWVYNLQTEEKRKLFDDGHSPQWSPTKNELAFLFHRVLNISDLKKFNNVVLGAGDYTWLPDGDGFLLSSVGVLRPDGWSGAILYKKHLPDNHADTLLSEGANHFFTLPDEIGINAHKIISVYANHLTFSPSNEWISFIVTPTASMAMDSNMLCVISQDGTDFQVIDEIILQVGKPKWAPTKDVLAFIGGGGRLVFGFKEKDLKVREMVLSNKLTPDNYADLDFTWTSDHTIVSSRIEEQEWTNDFSKHPLPSLYVTNLEGDHQKLTNPPGGLGDYEPYYVTSADKLVWVRKTSFLDEEKTFWIANKDGTEAKEWLKDVDSISFYEG